MNIIFPQETHHSWFAIAQDVEYQNHWCEELIFAEITELGPLAYEIRWEDDYGNPRCFEDRATAESYIKKHYGKHKPYYNGPRKFISS